MLRVPASAIMCAEDMRRQAFAVRQGKDLGAGQPCALDPVQLGAELLRQLLRGFARVIGPSAAEVLLFDDKAVRRIEKSLQRAILRFEAGAQRVIARR